MKVGEIWLYKHKEALLASDFYCYEDGDEKVKIGEFLDGGRIMFTHVVSGAMGVLHREHFLQSYSKVYE